MIRALLLFLLISWTGEFSQVLSEIHVGTFCTQHEDCIRYCAYSKYGPEGASCCFPEKVRVSKSTWLSTGSNTCYCCPSSHNYQLMHLATEEGKNVLTTPIELGVRRNRTENKVSCLRYLSTQSEDTPGDDVSNEFCRSGKCIQAMVIMKMAFEYPSVCRSKKFSQIKL